MPDDLRTTFVEVLGDTDITRGEIESFDLMALAGVATPATWATLRNNLADPACVAATGEFARAWEAGDVDKLVELVPRGLMRGVADTLVPGDLPLTAADTGWQAAQQTALEKLAGEFRA